MIILILTPLTTFFTLPFVTNSNHQRTMASKKDTTPVDVTWEDQKNICFFGRIHRRFNEIQEEIARLKADIEKFTDAADEIIIADDVKYAFGESFVNMDADETGDVLEAKKTQLEGELSELNEEKAILEKEIETRRAHLYAKFGSQIYLEDN